MFKIESGVPIPKSAANAGGRGKPRRRYHRFHFDKMSIGDSFLIPYSDDQTHHHTQTRLGSAAKNWARKHPGSKPTFTTRQTETGVRVWRVT